MSNRYDIPLGLFISALQCQLCKNSKYKKIKNNFPVWYLYICLNMEQMVKVFCKINIASSDEKLLQNTAFLISTDIKMKNNAFFVLIMSWFAPHHNITSFDRDTSFSKIRKHVDTNTFHYVVGIIIKHSFLSTVLSELRDYFSLVWRLSRYEMCRYIFHMQARP